ncbi:MAG: calcium/sodium antiporter [Alistipes sp.]|nr:calcium/sodium antiporter [Alistipes sp.]
MDYVILAIALVAIVLGANMLVSGSADIARRFKISDFVIGALIVGVGTSFPELLVSCTGAIQGKVDVAIGNVVGSNIFNILGILGITALLHPVAVHKDNIRFELPFCIGISLFATLLAFNFFCGDATIIGRVDGVILIAIFLAYTYASFLRDRKKGVAPQSPQQPQAEILPLPRAIIRTLAGLAVLIVGCDFFVDSAVNVATAWGVNEAFISITLIACGTSLPELAASVAAAAKRNTELALGNVVGSSIFNLAFILGVSSQITPLSGGGITVVDYAVMIGAAVMLLIFSLNNRISRMEGITMLGCFVAYNVYLIYTQTL